MTGITLIAQAALHARTYTLVQPMAARMHEVDQTWGDAVDKDKGELAPADSAVGCCTGLSAPQPLPKLPLFPPSPPVTPASMTQ